jgi:hypothetical protein
MLQSTTEFVRPSDAIDVMCRGFNKPTFLELSMTSGAITCQDLKNESDVEQKVIYPLLSGGNYLAINDRHIKTKDYMAPSRIDKSAGKSIGYYPD